MNIAEMHVWFRQYAQQMGMQNVRAILPEQIDLLINTSISDIINQLIKENIGMTNDRIISDNSKIGQINAFRTLYKVVEVENLYLVSTGRSVFNSGETDDNPDINDTDDNPDINDTNDSNNNTHPGENPQINPSFNKSIEGRILRLYQSFTKMNVNSNNKITITNNPTNPFDYLFLVDFSINYKLGNSTTNLYPVRLIDDAFLADTLNDFILKPKFRSPISVIYNNQLDLYIDYVKDDKLPQNLIPNKLRISYVAKPNKVCYMDDVDTSKSVDCNLPEQMHVDILKHAVDLYRVSIAGALSNAQQQEQAQQRENARNNYRNDET